MCMCVCTCIVDNPFNSLLKLHLDILDLLPIKKKKKIGLVSEELFMRKPHNSLCL